MSRSRRNRSQKRRPRREPAAGGRAGIDGNIDVDGIDLETGKRPLKRLVGSIAALVVAGAALWLLLRTHPAQEPKDRPSTDSTSTTIRAVAPGLPASVVDPAVAIVIEQAQQRVRQEPQSARAIGELGRLYHAHKLVDLARASYERAHELDPSTPDWPYYLALFAADRGDAEQAITLLETVVRLLPDYAPAYYHLGGAALALGRLDRAQHAYERVASLAPDGAWGPLGLARVARRQRDLPEAARHLERALTLDPQNHEATYLLAMTRRELGDEGAARMLLARLPSSATETMTDAILRRALEQQTDLESRNQTANRLLAEGRIDAAESLYKEILASDEEHYDALYNLGLLYNRSQRYDEAQRVLERATRSRPDNADARFLLAMTYLSLEQPGAALEQLDKALELDPKHALARDLEARLSAPLPGSH